MRRRWIVAALSPGLLALVLVGVVALSGAAQGSAFLGVEEQAAPVKAGGQPDPAAPNNPNPPGNEQNSGQGANTSPGPYDPTGPEGPPSDNGRGEGTRTGQPAEGTRGNADIKNPPGQLPGPQDGNAGYECDRNQGIAVGNPAHTGCQGQVAAPTSTPQPTSTPVPPTSTPVPPTNTPVPPTATPVPPTSTPEVGGGGPTATPVPPTATPEVGGAGPTPPPTNTPIPGGEEGGGGGGEGPGGFAVQLPPTPAPEVAAAPPPPAPGAPVMIAPVPQVAAPAAPAAQPAQPAPPAPQVAEQPPAPAPAPAPEVLPFTGDADESAGYGWWMAVALLLFSSSHFIRRLARKAR